MLGTKVCFVMIGPDNKSKSKSEPEPKAWEANVAVWVLAGTI